MIKGKVSCILHFLLPQPVSCKINRRIARFFLIENDVKFGKIRDATLNDVQEELFIIFKELFI